MATRLKPVDQDELAELFLAARSMTIKLAQPLSDVDTRVQPMPDASPAKWQFAYSNWFFEAFILRDNDRAHQMFDANYHLLFDSSHEGEGKHYAWSQHELITRPALDEIRTSLLVTFELDERK